MRQVIYPKTDSLFTTPKYSFNDPKISATISEAAKKRILVVDDEQDLNFTLKAILEEIGSFQVESFTSPILALSEFKAGVYDLAVLDIRMPGMNGFELCRKLKDVDDRLKICFLTATELLYYRETDSDVIDDLGIDCPNLLTMKVL